MTKALAIAATVLLVSLGACVSVTRATDADRVRELDASYDQVFDATIAALFEFDADILAGGKDSGFVTARANYGGEVASALLLGQVRTVYGHWRISFQHSAQPLTMSVRITSAYEDGSYERELAASAYQEFWTAFDSHLQPVSE